MNNDQRWLLQMRSLLHHNVPRFIKHIAQRGGVSAQEWEWLQFHEDMPDDPKKWNQYHKDAVNYPQGLLEKGDEYLLFPKDEEVFKKSLFVLVKAIAIMSFVPGGVRFFGLQFCSQVENFVVVEDGSEEA